MTTSSSHADIFTAATAAAREAVAQAKARWSANGQHHDRGACGFAWVKVRPATSSFARWCAKMAKESSEGRHGQSRQYGHLSYNGGWEFWNPGGYEGQNVDIKEAGAVAFERVLNENGVKAYAGSRLD